MGLVFYGGHKRGGMSVSERLTCKYKDGWRLAKAGGVLCIEVCHKHKCEACPIDEAIYKLAAYEDSGLSPKQVMSMSIDFAERAMSDAVVYQNMEMLQEYTDTGLTPAEVAELAQAKKDGRLIVLPCKIGDTVYFKLNGNIRENKISEIIILGYNIRFEFDNKDWFTIDSINYEVFLTREEAEAALQLD